MNFPPDQLDGSPIATPIIPLGRAANAREIAGAIAYLVSADAAYITGATVIVDGGLGLVSGPTTLAARIGQTDPQGDNAR
jgi:NAD(P)-dependent dehydrogenase (short-subunit alcohol dehydrogenase family)